MTGNASEVIDEDEEYNLQGTSMTEMSELKESSFSDGSASESVSDQISKPDLDEKYTIKS